MTENGREVGAAGTLEVISLAFGELEANIKGFLTYEILFKILSILVLGPIFVVVGAYFISFTGHSTVSNERLAAYFLSVPGILSAILWGVSEISALLAEFAGLMLIAYASLGGRPVSGTRALVFSLKSIPNIIIVGAMQVLVWAGLSFPFLLCAGLTYLGLLTAHDISFYPAQRPPSFQLAVAIGVVLGVGLLSVSFYLFTSWLFALPVCLFEGRTMYHALTRSRALVKGSFRRIAGMIVLSLDRASWRTVSSRR